MKALTHSNEESESTLGGLGKWARSLHAGSERHDDASSAASKPATRSERPRGCCESWLQPVPWVFLILKLPVFDFEFPSCETV
jgi:hypothetical protein